MRLTDTSDLWWKTAIFYNLDVKTFLDWNDDGIGDFQGVAHRLDHLAELGVTSDKFTPAAWRKATVGGTPYAVPLDTHPFVLFYNVDLARKAGLLNAAGDGLVPMKDKDDFADVIQSGKSFLSPEAAGCKMT